ncbi:MAG: Protoporphyrinogen oxidase [Burkholderiaceae bacterium]|nr:Protoporphyrinogen oxidase [Burkholderiaceae bacterium]
MANFLMLYSTTDGHTLEICRRLQQQIEAGSQSVTLLPIDEAPATAAELEAFDRIVLGASIRYGRHGKPVADFIQRHRALLERKPNAFFSVNLVARKPQKNTPQTNPYLKKFLRRVRWQPKQMAVFAGKLDYPRYGRLDRAIIRFIMLITGGPTDPASTTEFTDWSRVDAFAQELCRHDSMNG